MLSICGLCGGFISLDTGRCSSCGSAPQVKQSGPRKNVMIVVALVVGLGALCAGVLGFIGWRMMTDTTSGQAANVSETELGVRLYPGSVLDAKSVLRVKTEHTESVSAQYATSDSASKVESYFQEKLNTTGEKVIVEVSQDNQATTLRTKNKSGSESDDISVVVTPSVQPDGQTKIVIMRMKTLP